MLKITSANNPGNLDRILPIIFVARNPGGEGVDVSFARRECLPLNPLTSCRESGHAMEIEIVARMKAN
jgi:hypothetical protein